MSRSNILYMLPFLFSALAPAQFQESVERTAGILQRLEGSLEGYASSVSGQTINYSRIRPDRPIGLLVRTSTGAMAIEWKTPAMPRLQHGMSVSFVITAGMGTREGPRKKFEFSVNGIPRFEFGASGAESWSVNGASGGTLVFDRTMQDVYNDVFGYLRISLPADWLKAGEPVRLGVAGRNDSLSGWFIAYQDSEVVPYLREKVANEAYCDIHVEARGSQLAVSVAAPSTWIGKQYRCVAANNQIWSGTFASVERRAGTTFSTDSPGGGAPIRFVIDGEVISPLERPQRDTIETRIYDKKLVTLKGRIVKQGVWEWEYRSTRTTVGTSLLQFSQSSGGEGVQHLIISTHQDIAWMDSPDQCVRDRDEKIITPALEILRKNPAYVFGLEDVLCLREYLDRHPDRKDELGELITGRRLTIGASYTQPYEELCSGEMLVRQFYAGRKWLKAMFPGADTRTYWNVDVPGRTLQMPQILSKSGIDYLVMSRFGKGLYSWLSPDGSSVVAYSPSHYGDFSGLALGKEFQEMADYIAKAGRDWNQLIHKGGKNIPILCMSDMSTPVRFEDIFEKWNSITSITEPGKPGSSVRLPPLRYSSAEQFLDAAMNEKPLLPLITGERPDIWLYIHGPTHHWAISAKREADAYLPAAEIFSTIDGLLSRSFAGYPQRKLTEAWESQIYPDHGWGGKNGEITDSTFRWKYEHARDIAKQVLEQSTRAIAGRVKTAQRKGIPVIVFNSLSWIRSAPVSFTATFSRGAIKQGLAMTDAAGKLVPMQSLVVERYGDRSLKSIEIVFVAERVPSLGYATFYLKPSSTNPALALSKPTQSERIENPFYRISLGDGGVKQIHDNELGLDILNTSKFLGGELFTMRSVGEDAGEWVEPQYPDMEGFDKLSAYKPSWQLVESGDVRQVAECRQAMTHTTVVQRIILYRRLKQVDFETSLLGWDGTKYREFRVAFPLNIADGRIVYEVPFGTVQVGKDEMKGPPGERYTQPAPEIHPRGVQNWIGMFNNTLGVTISSSVAVWDEQDPTDRAGHSSLLQPILLASRRSCHGEGPWYLQKGNHHFRFSLMSHQPGWENGRRFGAGANVPMVVVFSPTKVQGSSLPEQESFLSVDGENIAVSTMKKGEVDDSIILRVYDDEGKSHQVRLRYAMPIKNAAMTNLVEEGAERVSLQPGGITFELGHHSIQTIKLTPSFEK